MKEFEYRYPSWHADARFLIFCIVVSAVYAAIFPTWEMAVDPAYQSGGPKLRLCFLIFCYTLPLTIILAANRYVFSATFPVLCIVSAACAYSAYGTGTPFSLTLLDLAFNTPPRLALDYVNALSVGMVAAAALFSIGAIIYRFKRIGGTHPLFLAVSLVAMFQINTSGIAPLAPTLDFLPRNLYAVSKNYYDTNRAASQVPRTDFDETPTAEQDSLTVVFVIGESLRADHLGINGYHRQTTPCLAHEQNLVSLPDIYEPGGMTHLSVPCLITRALAPDDKPFAGEHSFISLFRKSGFRTSWLANQEPLGTTRILMRDADTTIMVGPLCERTDNYALPHYHRLVNAPDKRNLVVFHSLGVHYPYSHHPYECHREIFTPSFDDKKPIRAGNPSEIINAYDNAVIHNDSILSELIKPLRHRNAILFYCSDHGENLGEGGNFIHSTHTPQTHHPAALIWYSEEYLTRHPGKIKNLKANAQKPLHNAVFFHSVLDAVGMESRYIDTTLSLFTHHIRLRDPRLKTTNQ